jgi:nickel transport protein
MKRFRYSFLLVVVWSVAGLVAHLMIWVSPVQAHKVTVFAWVEGDTIHTESKFSSGKMVKAGRIDVFNSRGDLLLTGTTDDQGAFSFAIPEHDDLKVVLTAGSGHGNHWIVRAAEMNPEQADVQSVPAANRPVSSRVPDETLQAPGACLDKADIEAMVARIMDAKLAPLRAQLADPAWGLRDILSGIGYILGLMGLAAYIQHRKQTK